MKGVGYCCVLISWYVSFYYNVIIGWTVYFIVTTLTSGKCGACIHLMSQG
jgi:solute carrier family 6 noradrenalin transporter-like protein 2